MKEELKPQIENDEKNNLNELYKAASKKKEEEPEDQKFKNIDFLVKDRELPSTVVKKLKEKVIDRKNQHSRSELKLKDKISDQNIDETIKKEIFDGLKKDHGEMLYDDVEDEIKRLFEESWDDRFKISKDKYLMQMVIDDVGNRIDSNKEVSELNKSAVIFFDIDGLKAVNDNVGHLQGDKYLNKVSEFLYQAKVTEWLEGMGVEVIPAHRSGDEFLLSLSADIDISTPASFKGVNNEVVNEIAITEYAQQEYEKELKEIPMQDIQDLSDEKIKRKYADDFEARNLEMPNDFEFKASMSGGWSSLKEGLSKLSQKQDDISSLSFADIKRGVASMAFDRAGKRMEAYKKEKKKQRMASSDPNERIMQTIYDSNRIDHRA